MIGKIKLDFKGEKDNNRLARDKPGGVTLICKGWCAHEVL